MTHQSIRQECHAANLQVQACGLVDLTFGNVSVINESRTVMAIKPSGVDYAALTPENMVLVSIETGETIEGDLRPSSDTPTHRRLYQLFPSIRAVVHTHSRNAVAFAQAPRGIPCLGTTHADYFHGEVPVTRVMTPEEIAGDYEWNTANVVGERFRSLDPDAVPAVLVHGHGPFVWGPGGAKAVENAFALEVIAEMALKTLQLNPSGDTLNTAQRDKHYFRKHGPGAYYGQEG